MGKHHFIKFAALLLVCCIFFGCTPEEEIKLGTIYGTVTDYASGNPINNAIVRLNPRGETTLTGSDGTFQFNDLPSGSYSLLLSKNGYVDLDDDYVIKIEDGNTVQRAIQMQKLSSSLQIVDNSGNEIALLDFGADEDVSQKAFNIFNNGNMTLDFSITKTANWIDDVIPSSGAVVIGDTKPITVIINRASLESGENKSTLLITTPTAGSVEIIVKATVPFIPIVETGEVEDVTNNSAKSKGDVTDNGGVTVIEKGICFALTENPTIDDQRVSAGPGVGPFTCSLTGLQENKTYYVRAYAINSVGAAYGVQKSFITKGRPSVLTLSIFNISAYNASCSGNVSSEGGSLVTERGVCWNLAPNPTINNSTVTSGSGMGSFTCNLTNLTNSTTYYVRAYAKNSFGVSYGEEESFTTELLPTFQFGGHMYQVAPGLDTKVQWSVANSYCNNLTLYGLSGWRLPTKDELLQMYAERDIIGGFHTEYNGGSRPGLSDYWSRTEAGYGLNHMRYYAVSYYNGNVNAYEDYDSAFENCNVRPIRMIN